MAAGLWNHCAMLCNAVHPSRTLEGCIVTYTVGTCRHADRLECCRTAGTRALRTYGQIVNGDLGSGQQANGRILDRPVRCRAFNVHLAMMCPRPSGLVPSKASYFSNLPSLATWVTARPAVGSMTPRKGSTVQTSTGLVRRNRWKRPRLLALLAD